MRETLVVALGGNSITRPGELGTIPEQFAHTAETLRRLRPLLCSDCGIVITHGNGPQIGNILIRSEEGERRVPPLPFDTCVSDSQGGMGYMIQRLACELFHQESVRRGVVTVITMVEVDSNDPDFAHPSKPIGEFYDQARAERVQAANPHWLVQEILPGKFRRVVPSPRPVKIVEEDAIARLVDAGTVVIACGGGGIPVEWKDGSLVGVEGVIDKDFSSSLLASGIGADRLVIVTSVERAALHYGQPGETWLDSITTAEARALLGSGEFAAGSMWPKIDAGVAFVESGGRECIITSAERVAQALEGRAGTRIVRENP